jgi:HEAT repeat protein
VLGGALAKFGDSRAIEALLAALHEPDKDVRRRATLLLAEIGGAQVIKALITTALQDEETDVRHGAIVALGKIGDSRALLALEELAQPRRLGNRWLRQAVNEAIEHIRGRQR